MKYLVDTNIWLEIMLEQDKAGACREFLAGAPPGNLFVTDFSMHSIGVILTRLKRAATLRAFYTDLGRKQSVTVVHLSLGELAVLPAVSRRFGLDFDDALQYAAASSRELTLVSLDSDFERTDISRLVPGE